MCSLEENECRYGCVVKEHASKPRALGFSVSARHIGQVCTTITPSNAFSVNFINSGSWETLLMCGCSCVYR